MAASILHNSKILKVIQNFFLSCLSRFNVLIKFNVYSPFNHSILSVCNFCISLIIWTTVPSLYPEII